jgi:hypothetical protein
VSYAERPAQPGVFIVPARFVDHLRAALLWQLGQAAEDIWQLSLEPGEPERWKAYASALARQDAIRAVLSLTGWEAQPAENDVSVNLDRHAEPLLAGLRFSAEYETRKVTPGDSGSRARPDSDAQTFGLCVLANRAEQVVASLSVASWSAELALRRVTAERAAVVPRGGPRGPNSEKARDGFAGCGARGRACAGLIEAGVSRLAEDRNGGSQGRAEWPATDMSCCLSSGQGLIASVVQRAGGGRESGAPGSVLALPV